MAHTLFHDHCFDKNLLFEHQRLQTNLTRLLTKATNMVHHISDHKKVDLKSFKLLEFI